MAATLRVIEEVSNELTNVENENVDEQLGEENPTNVADFEIENDGDNDGDGENNGDGENDVQELDNENTTERKKRKKTSKVWDEFNEVILPDGQRKQECYHCKKKLALDSTGATTQFERHLEHCASRMRALKKQKVLHFQPKDNGSVQTNEDEGILSSFKYDHDKVREMIAHYILINKKPFSVVEEFGFNLVLKSMSPYFMKYSRATACMDVKLVYEKEKRMLWSTLKSISRISFTIDLWKSKNQNISYMVITAHYVDSSWRLQKRVLNFLHLPPLHTAFEIVDTFYKALFGWGAENKVFTISVDNEANNDTAIKLLKDNFRVKKKLFFGGRLFHVRCCAHILNLMVKDGINSIDHVVDKIRDTISFVNASEARLSGFANVGQQLQLPTIKLAMDCPTRWNSTYCMLTIALQLREAFFAYRETEIAYVNCPIEEEWDNIEKVCDVLGFFNEATNIISGTEYPTSNLFLSQVCTIKKVLDEGAVSSDYFIMEMTRKMKEKFDKYWDECNLLMAFGAIMDPRMKFVVIDFAYAKIYNGDESIRNVSLVRSLLYELFEEYATCAEAEGVIGTSRGGRTTVNSSANVNRDCEVDGMKNYSGWHDFTTFVKAKANKRPIKSDLDKYLEDGLEICPDGQSFDVIAWWKSNHTKYPILSRMAVEILCIPISTVASESAFNVGERVIDTCYSKFDAESAQDQLICGSNWVCCHYGLKGRIEEEDDDEEVGIP